MYQYHSFNTFRNCETNLNSRMPCPPTQEQHIYYNSVQRRNIRNLLRRNIRNLRRRGVRPSMINRVPPKPRLNNNL